MVQKLWILDPKIKISSPFQTTNLWSEFQTWFSNSMMLKSCLACFKDSKKPPHMEAPKSWGWLYPQCSVCCLQIHAWLTALCRIFSVAPHYIFWRPHPNLQFWTTLRWKFQHLGAIAEICLRQDHLLRHGSATWILFHLGRNFFFSTFYGKRST